MVFNVEPDALCTHAGEVDGLAGSLSEAVDAAAYLARANDGYGLLNRPFVEILLTAIHDATAAELKRTHDGMAVLPGKVQKCADVFGDQDKERASILEKITEKVEQPGIPEGPGTAVIV